MSTTHTPRRTTRTELARRCRADVPPPLRFAHRGAGARYVARPRRRALLTMVDSTIVLGVLAVALVVMVLGWTGREDLREACRAEFAFPMVATDAISADQATCLEEFGPRGF